MTHAHVDELDRIELADGFEWRPVRRRFGIRAFGVNAYAPGATGQIVEEHSESMLGHQEIYLVLRGRARFTVDGNDHELAPGELVFVRHPSLQRSAVALTDDTIVLALGGKPGSAHEPSAWEAMFAAVPAAREGRWADAIRMHEEALVEQPNSAPLLYNLACMESRGGRPLDALLHLTRAIALDAKWAEHAAKDTDFDPIRSEPGFPS
ncbi:MAG TPA: cupin domain-containing protein [Gaiellaceae bacterium]|jgi:quercetin dioxygenase-like cupin family protein